MPGGARAGAGRKTTPIDLLDLEKLCSLQCSDQEIADWFGVSLRTIQNRRAQRKFGDVMRRGEAKGSVSIRRAQMRLVEAGSAPMIIWLGKVRLGQRDNMQGGGGSHAGHRVRQDLAGTGGKRDEGPPDARPDYYGSSDDTPRGKTGRELGCRQSGPAA
jgi:hypothetical protein